MPARHCVDVLGVPVDRLTVPDLHDRILRFVREGRKATILHANVHAINLAHRHVWFATALRAADIVLCDGFGVMLGARLLRQNLPERITYAEWTWQLAAFCEREGLSMYLLGGRPEIAAAAAGKLLARFPALRIAGTHDGYFDKTPGGSQDAAVIAAVNGTRPDIVLVGFGMPLQEEWVSRHRDRIDAHVVLTVGAAFDYVSGTQRRAPQWMTSRGLEWLGRLAMEPRRLAARYLLGNPLFIYRVVRQRVRGG